MRTGCFLVAVGMLATAACASAPPAAERTAPGKSTDSAAPEPATERTAPGAATEPATERTAPGAASEPAAAADPALGIAIEQLAGPVWIHRSFHDTENWGRVEANGLIVLGASGAVVVDTGWTPEHTRWLLDWAKRATGHEAVAVIVTHSHGDRAAGIGAALERGIRVHAYRGTAELLRERGQAGPSRVFARTLELDLGDVTVESFYPGPGHTSDNSVVFVPGQKLLFGGCLIRSAATTDLGNVADADLEAWPQTMRQLLERYGRPQIVVPGHGPVGGAGLLTHTLELAERAP